MMREWLRCPTCHTRLQLDEENRCVVCEVPIKTFRGGFDFLPEGAHSALAGHVRPTWNDWAARLDALEKWRASRRAQPNLQQKDKDRLQSVVSFVAPFSGPLLDLGCGSASLKQFLSEDIFYVGVDPLPGQELMSQGFVIRGVAEYLPFADQTFSTVAMLSVFDYFVDPERALAETKRVLSPGGVVMMVITVRPKAVARAFHAKGPGAVLVSFCPSVLCAVGLRGAWQLAQMQVYPERKAHVSYFSEDKLLSLVKKYFEIENMRYHEPGVLFLRLIKSKET